MNTLKFIYPAIFHKEEIGYSVWLYDIDGCISQGDTLAEAFENIKDAIGLYYEDYKESGTNPPVPTEPAQIKNLEPCEFVALVEFDYSAYLRKVDTRAVKKTLTIPSWLNEAAEAKRINFSGVLQDALKQQLGL